MEKTRFDGNKEDKQAFAWNIFASYWDWGVIYSPYCKNENGYSYFLNLGDKVSFYSLTGDTGECLGEVISLGPDTEFVVKVEKDWLKQSDTVSIEIAGMNALIAEDEHTSQFL